MNSRVIVILFFWFGTFHSTTSLAQIDGDFTPCKTFSARSSSKIRALKKRTETEIDKIISSKKNKIAEVLRDRFDFLEREFENNRFLDDSVLQNVVDRIWQRIVTANSLQNKPGEILISKSSDLNAVSYGEGTVILNVGLLGRVRNESQLAFALAHELAHYELKHTLASITKQLENPEKRNITGALARLRKGQFNEADILVVQKWIFTTSSFHREDETRADSLGFIFFKNAGYRQDQATELLYVLDSAYAAKYNSGRKLFEPFNFSSLPFKSSLLNDPKQRFPVDTLRELFLDSIRSHPHLDARIKNLSQWITQGSGQIYLIDKNYFLNAVRLAELESVQAAFDNDRFDKSLFQALQLKPIYPNSDYLSTMIARVLLSLNIQRIKAMQYRFVAGSSGVYKYDLRAVVNFLNNIDLRDLRELTFRFINSKSNFNPANEEHYFILWKICSLTDRKETMNKVEATYEANFPNGQYLSDMRKVEKPLYKKSKR